MSKNIPEQPFSLLTLLGFMTGLVPLAFEIFSAVPEWKERQGIDSCIKDPSKNLIAKVYIGRSLVPPQPTRSILFCEEKCDRLAGHPDHLSSFQSRNEDKDEYGGAIRLPRGLLFSASGVPELGDEALCLVGAFLSEEMTEREMWDVARLSDNKLYFPALLSYGKQKFLGR